MLTEPDRPNSHEVEAELDAHVRLLAGPQAHARPEQLAAVRAVVAERRRTLLVARTGFGKSAVYFSITRMLRDRGWGPTVVVSPLLALMRDQVAAAQRLGLAAVSINSSNVDDWDELEAQLIDDRVDLLLIAPERLANAGFRRRVFDSLLARPITLVCDEAHCISDWGHDFRPDYRRLRALIDQLPGWTPVLATTATANARVTDDVAAQLGPDALVLRTSLDRASLHLSAVDLPDDAHRLAWMHENLERLPGSGIIYCLTVDQAEATAAWLRANGHRVAAYTGAVDPDRRRELEAALSDNRLRALVATSALGMGFDKGDLAFCVHLGLPPSPVAYYQQIGRAGRALERAEVVALPRPDQDAAVWRWFESVALPSEELCQRVLDQLDLDRPTGLPALELAVNLGRSRLENLLKLLEVEGGVERVDRGWVRTERPWAYDRELAATLSRLRREEADQMTAWAQLDSCRLRFLRAALDDEGADDCGRCDTCTGRAWSTELDAELVANAHRHLRADDPSIEQRRQWPPGLGQPRGRIPAERRPATGRALARAGDGGWGPVVDRLIRDAEAGRPSMIDRSVLVGVAGVLRRWEWGRRPRWICPVPSRRRSGLIEALAEGIAEMGSLPVHRALVPSGSTAVPEDSYQADMANSVHQLSNVWARYTIDHEALPDAELLSGPVLLVDDEAVSRWTLTVASWLLTGAGAESVLPFVLRTR